ncbi:hypothetical protein [Pseudoalteromonas luteoviolacea]|uniref:Condensation domain-containing protein n=1 Tax=Pseudoalteromonas luteoviolacea NCIMB 1942 TaxID=1365253 RepID=A0A167H8U7_9GAMM|nr:hypothetical protein [Pseudoalteromonas luteoviolacea]KZN57765.1 hypothetical protein N482_04500 [Pseudoalteromonas luteoviolacea NCIMB 1942]KZW99867.1 hypothetical protein JL49_14655 [Pseudoalteromonas luteoviolacea]
MKDPYPLIPLSARSLNFLALADANDNGNSCDLVILKGCPDKLGLTQAVDKIAKTHPVMQSRIVRKNLRYYWQFDEHLLPEKEFLNWSYEFDCFELWHSALRNHLFKDIVEPFNSSPVKFICIQYRQYFALLFLSSHIASDGSSGYLLFKQLSAYLNSEPIAVADNSFAREPTLFDSCGTKAYLTAAKQLARNLVRPCSKVVLNKGKSNKCQVEYVDLGEGATKSLVDWSKQRGCSVNVALNYILSESLCGGRRLGVLETMSVRDISKQSLEYAYNNLVIVFESYIGGSNTWIDEYAKHLQKLKCEGYRAFQAQQEIQAISINLLPRVALKRLVRIYKRFFLKGNVILSNLGVVDFDLSHVGKYEIVDVYNFSVPLPPAGLAIVVSTYRQKLRISFAHRGDDISDFMKAIEANILSIK